MDLFVLFGPDAADQLGRLHGPVGERNRELRQVGGLPLGGSTTSSTLWNQFLFTFLYYYGFISYVLLTFIAF